MVLVFKKVKVIRWADFWGVQCHLSDARALGFPVGSKAEAERFADELAKTAYPDSLARWFGSATADS
jgi:hypothetical protein